MMPDISAGSNHVGARDMCTPQVSWPSVLAALIGPGVQVSKVRAKRAMAVRRVGRTTPPPRLNSVRQTTVGSPNSRRCCVPSRLPVIVSSSFHIMRFVYYPCADFRLGFCRATRPMTSSTTVRPACAGTPGRRDGRVSGGQRLCCCCASTPARRQAGFIGRAKSGPATEMHGKRMQQMRENRDEPGLASPHGVSLRSRAEMP